jgi:hypothetical protein
MRSTEGLAHYERSSPTLLAQQPPSLPYRPEQPDLEWDAVYAHLESRLGMGRTWRYSYWMHWAEIAQFLLPQRYRWLVVANLFRRGSPINQAIIDSTAGLARDIASSGMVDGIFPSTRPWFKHAVGIPGLEPDTEGKNWLEDLDAAMVVVLAQSNFYDRMAQAMQDLVAFCTAPAVCYEDAEDVVRFHTPCTGEYYLFNGARLSVDAMYTENTYTVSQQVDKFGLEACSVGTQEKWRAGGASLEMEDVVACAIEPNFPLDGRGRPGGKEIKVIPGGFPYREIWWLRGQKTNGPLSIRGFWDKPFAAARWATTGNDPYGNRGPGIDALGDIKQLQQETKRKLEAIEKQVRPPMGADPEMKNEPSSTTPGGITYVNSQSGKKGFWPLFEVKPDLAAMALDIKDVQTRIDRCFMVDVFMAISQMEGVQPRNAIEIAERKGEKLQRLGPVVGFLKSEFASPLLQRVANIIMRRRMLKPMPRSLMGVPLKLDYMDMVTLAQLGAETANMESTLATVGNLGALAQAAGLPPPLRIFNLDESARILAERKTFPARGLFTAAEVEAHDKAKAQQAQQAQAVQAAQAGVEAAGTLGKVDANTGNMAGLLGSRMGLLPSQGQA